jgi:hypothetical protein
MNRPKVITETVRVLKAEYPAMNVYPESQTGLKTKPYLVVAVSSEDPHDLLIGASELDMEFIIGENDEDGGGLDPETVNDFICSDEFRTEINLGGIIDTHRVEITGTEIEREETSTMQTILAKLWCFRV